MVTATHRCGIPRGTISLLQLDGGHAQLGVAPPIALERAVEEQFHFDDWITLAVDVFANLDDTLCAHGHHLLKVPPSEARPMWHERCDCMAFRISADSFQVSVTHRLTQAVECIEVAARALLELSSFVHGRLLIT